MIGRLNHVAIAVPDIAKAAAVYRDTLGAQVSEKEPQPDHGVNTVFITLPNTKIELLEPIGEDSPIAKFLERNGDGGIHHICYEVDDIVATRDKLVAAGARGVAFHDLLADLHLHADLGRGGGVAQPDEVTAPALRVEFPHPVGEVAALLIGAVGGFHGHFAALAIDLHSVGLGDGGRLDIGKGIGRQI